MRTAEARLALPAEISHADASFTVARAALLGAGIAGGSAELLTAAFADRLHEPYRPSAILDAVRAELPAGAVGATLSGSGPTVIVWADDPDACAAELEGRFPDDDRDAARRLGRGRPLKLPWDVELGEPFFAPFSKLVAPVRLPDGTRAVREDPPSTTTSRASTSPRRCGSGTGTVRCACIDHDPSARRA